MAIAGQPRIGHVGGGHAPGIAAAGLAVLRAEPFDAGAFAEVLDRQNARAAARQQRGQEILVSYVAAMSPEGRAAFADRVAEALERGDRRHK